MLLISAGANANENIENRAWVGRSRNRVHGEVSTGAASRTMGMGDTAYRLFKWTCNLVQHRSAVSGGWDEGSTKINDGRFSGVMLDDHSALVSICDQSGNGYYPTYPDFGREFGI